MGNYAKAQLNEIIDFIGEYVNETPEYSPQCFSVALIEQFGLAQYEAQRIALLIQQEIYNKITLAAIELNVTFNCNLACEYCFVHNKSPEDRMKAATAKKAIDLLLANAYPKVTITLFGGEPLLEFELIKTIVPYAVENAKRKDIAVEWAITTNGTLVNQAILEFFAQYQIYMLLSIDGGPETHDRYRRTKSGQGTWQGIAETIPLIRQYQGWLGTRMTVSTEAIGSMKDDFKQLVQLGINQFIIAPAQGAQCWNQQQVSEYAFNLKEICKEYHELKEAGAPVFIEEFEDGEKEPKGWGCRAGVTSLAIAPNGDVSPCSKLLGLTDERGKWIIGNVNSDIDYGLLEPFKNSASRQPARCKQCTYTCTGGCYALNYEQTGDHFTPSEENCLFWSMRQQIINWIKANKPI